MSIVLHLFRATTPEEGHRSLEAMVTAAQSLLGALGIVVECATDVTLPASNVAFEVPRVGQCTRRTLTEDQRSLFSHRGIIPSTEIAVFYVRQMRPAVRGCAAFPDGEPGVVVSRSGTHWTLAHELGHILGLSHHIDRGNLMFDRTSTLQHPPPPLPGLLDTQVACLRASPFVNGSTGHG
jgi:hypothetical protein